MTNLGARPSFDSLDTNQDGVIDRQEWASANSYNAAQMQVSRQQQSPVQSLVLLAGCSLSAYSYSKWEGEPHHQRSTGARQRQRPLHPTTKHFPTAQKLPDSPGGVLVCVFVVFGVALSL